MYSLRQNVAGGLAVVLLGWYFFGARGTGAEGRAPGCEKVGTHFGYSRKIGLARIAELVLGFFYLTIWFGV